MEPLNNPMTSPEYSLWCLNYFKARYRERIAQVLSKKSGFSPHKVPNDPVLHDELNDGILPCILNDTVFYHSMIPRFTTEPTTVYQPGPDLVWEAFAVHAEEYVELQKNWGILAPADHAINVLEGILTYNRLQGVGVGLSYKYSRPTAQSLQLVINMLQRLDLESNHGQAMAVVLISRRLQILQAKFSTLRTSEPVLEDSIPQDSQWPLPLPMYYGLQLYLSEVRDLLVSQCIYSSIANLPRRGSHVEVGSQRYQAVDLILFSTAGTGKTHQILQLLQHCYGVYAVAPGVQSTSGDSSNLQPARGGASSDTLTIFNDLKDLDCAHYLINNFVMQCLVEPLMLGRQYLFKQFLSVQPLHEPSANYGDWTLLQINCSETCDPFDTMWKFSRLDGNSYRGHRESYDMNAWCIDEAQTAFDDPLAEAILGELWARGSIGARNVPRILSGTSLQLTEARKFVANAATAIETPGFVFYPKSDERREIVEITSLELITSRRAFGDLFTNHLRGILEELSGMAHSEGPLLTRAGRALGFPVILSPILRTGLEVLSNLDRKEQFDPNDIIYKDLCKLVATACTQFHGRYRFSTLFIEHILGQTVTTGQLNRNVIEAAIQSASTTIRGDLWRQLDRIQGAPWVEDLYWMAIRADVYSQSSIIKDKYARLVSEGFALVKSIDRVMSNPDQSISPNPNGEPTEGLKEESFVESVLCEPLAVSAVMTYLRSTGRYEDLVNRFFSLLQVDNADQGSIGKIAEYVLTCKLDNFLFDAAPPGGLSEQSKDAIRVHRRTEFYGVLASAFKIDYLQGCWEQDQNNFDGFVLCGHRVTPTLGQFQGTTISDWLNTLASGYHSRFLFPDKLEGPDLMFLLGRGNDKILCVLQFKTGKDEHQGAKVGHAVESLVKGLVNGLYNSFPHPIVFIDVVTTANKYVDQSAFLDKVDAFLREASYTPRAYTDYFTYIDAQTSATVWGETFHKLIRLMKGVE